MSSEALEQQVNLYQPILGAEDHLFSARAIGLGLGLIALTLGALAAFGTWRTSRVEASVRRLEAEQARQLARIERTDTTLKAGRSLESLEAEAKSLSADIATRERALDVLKAGTISPTTSFAARMEALARSQIEGLWLHDIALGVGEGRLALRGAAVDPTLVPAYLAALTAEPALAGVGFDRIDIERATPAEAPAALKFELKAPGLSLGDPAPSTPSAPPAHP